MTVVTLAFTRRLFHIPPGEEDYWVPSPTGVKLHYNLAIHNTWYHYSACGSEVDLVRGRQLAESGRLAELEPCSRCWKYRQPFRNQYL